MEKRKGFLTGRILFKWWQKLLLILGCTGLAALGAYLFCEVIASPVYITTLRNVMTAEDTAPLLSSADPSMTTVTLNIPAGLGDELGNVGQKGNKGLYYRNISGEIQDSTGTLLKPKDLKNQISVDEDETDSSHRTLRITVKGNDPETLRLIADAAVHQMGLLIFGAPAEEGQVLVSMAEEADRITIRYEISEAAAEALPDQFKGKTLDLIDPLENYLADDGFCGKVAAAAGINASAADIRRRISYTTTADPAALTITASWTDAESAERLLNALESQAAGAFYGGKAEVWQWSAGEITTVRENVREWPVTGVIVVIAALIALVISYALFSQQPLFDTIVVIFFVLFTLICVFPFYYLFINTISDNGMVAGGEVNFAPTFVNKEGEFGIHLRNYERIFTQGEIGQALIVTLLRTVIGTVLMVLMSAWAGYLVTKRKMWHRSFWYRALVVTMYFNAGLIPWYTNMLMLGLTGNFLAYILPGLVAPYNIILVKTYIESIPGSLEESAIIDGASTFKVFLRIILPLSIPILATIAIFGAVGNWNSFQDSLLLMKSTPNLQTLQHRLYVYLTQTTSLNTEQISEQMAQNLMNNGITVKYTVAMVTIIPILLVYPFMQRFFVKGIMLGAVKG